MLYQNLIRKAALLTASSIALLGCEAPSSNLEAPTSNSEPYQLKPKNFNNMGLLLKLS